MYRCISKESTVAGNPLNLKKDDNPMVKYVEQAIRAYKQMTNENGYPQSVATGIIQAAAMFAMTDKLGEIECQIDNLSRRFQP